MTKTLFSLSNYTILALVLLLLTLESAFAQNNTITGLWLIEHVQVGDEEMTPVAKWTRINKDGSYESGNGWMQNSAGTWTYDAAAKNYSPKDPLGLDDPFGPFKVRFEDGNMVWQREEEGMTVTVTLSSLKELPKAPADRVQGLWGLKTVTENETDITATFDPDHRNYLFIRWDRIYIERSPEGNRATGYWHMNGHRPEMTLLPHTSGSTPESWSVEAGSETLTLTGISESNKGRVMIFKRLKKFPN